MKRVLALQQLEMIPASPVAMVLSIVSCLQNSCIVGGNNGGGNNGGDNNGGDNNGGNNG